MPTGALLWQLAAITAFVSAAFLFYVVVKALWAEIGPMLRLLFHRGSHTELDDDDGVGLKR
jgi:hypothetical protein